jgi:hypothetical protein
LEERERNEQKIMAVAIIKTTGEVSLIYLNNSVLGGKKKSPCNTHF